MYPRIPSERPFRVSPAEVRPPLQNITPSAPVRISGAPDRLQRTPRLDLSGHGASVATAPARALGTVTPATVTPATVNYADRADVQAFIKDVAQRHGFDEQELMGLMRGVVKQEDALRRISSPSEGIDWHRYRRIFMTPERIAGGKAFLEEHKELFDRAEATYGVPRSMIAAILGVETFYGRITGDFPVLDALVTLGFDYPKRGAFFRSELEHFLLLARENNFHPTEPKGSYAGAMGWSQFISSSYRRLAVDFDGDGVKNLWEPADAIGSIANYFKDNGWQTGKPVAVPATVEGDGYKKLLGRSRPARRVAIPVADLAKHGVTAHGDLGGTDKVSFYEFQGENGKEYVVGLPNFQTITTYNHSHLYGRVANELRTGIEAQRATGDERPRPGQPREVYPNRYLEVLPRGTARDKIRAAGEMLGPWTLHIYGVPFDGPKLIELADTRPDEPFTRVLREEVRFAIDPDDFILFLDDVLRAGDGGLRGAPIAMSPSRARKSGIALHPDDVWKAPRLYGAKPGNLDLSLIPPAKHAPADDGDPLGPGWTARFPNPVGERARLEALREKNPEMADAIGSLLDQLRRQGALVALTSTVRRRERGYLMWGAFILSRASSAQDMERKVRLLETRNKEWGLNIDIQWRHPDGFAATRREARRMKGAYGVVFATERGARNSNHYDGEAADFVGRGLPRSLTLSAPNGETKTFDLSDPEHSRDISLSPEIIEWVEENFDLRKLKVDYPHWDHELTVLADAYFTYPSN